jgi:hypothetical protein
MLKRHLALGLILACVGHARASSLDVTASYRERAISYTNLNLNSANLNNQSYMSNDARFGVAVRKIELETTKSETEETMDVGILFRALGTAGNVNSSTSSLTTPLNEAANFYPSVNMTPFIENAYVKVHNLFGYPVTGTFGRQTFKLGSGLLLDDDGAGLTGVVLDGELPWGGTKLEGFIFRDDNPQYTSPNGLDLYGLALDVPTEGTWQFNELVEHDHSSGFDYGCNVYGVNPDLSGTAPLSCQISNAFRSFSSARYLISYGPMVFDGEAAIERGHASPSGILPNLPKGISYQGDAEVMKAKWKQHLPSLGDGIMRMSVARGSGDGQNPGAKDEAFFPSHGHQLDGMERSGFGDFFGASPYSALGGNYVKGSTGTLSGLAPGISGIITIGAGFTPPAYRGVTLDIDYFLFRADRSQSQEQVTLGSEWDFRIRYPIQDHFSLSASAAIFDVGAGSNPAKGTAKKYSLEAVGRF